MTLALLMALACAADPPGPASQYPPSKAIYQVRFAPRQAIVIDGRADEPAWTQAKVLTDFRFPWKSTPAPATMFRALCDANWLYFTFQVHDDDIVVLDRLRDEEDAVFEDRCELYFGRDPLMKAYFCAEIDSRGRSFDYSGQYYRQIDPKFQFQALEAKASPIDKGYVVEGRLSAQSLVAVGLPRLAPGAKFLAGVYRAEFSHDRSGRVVQQQESIHNRGRKIDGPPPLEAWISWIDPKTPEPDFHVPSSLGWFEVALPPSQ